MLRPFSGVNNRPRGLKPKDALHMSLILAVTTWILYHLTYTYENNSITEIYTQVKMHQEYKIEEERSLDVTGDPATAATNARNVVQNEKEERVVDTIRQDRGISEDKLNENDVEKGIEDGEKRIKEHEAREKSFRDDDASSAVFHDNQMRETKEEFGSENTSYPENQNTTIDGNKYDFILGNATINGTNLQKNTSHLGNFSEKPDRIENVHKNETVLLVNLNETYAVHGFVEDAVDEENRERN